MCNADSESHPYRPQISLIFVVVNLQLKPRRNKNICYLWTKELPNLKQTFVYRCSSRIPVFLRVL